MTIMKENSLISKKWDKEYDAGRYQNEPPIEFISKIKQTIRKYQNIEQGNGLYVGCGNGRNYIPLVKSDLNIVGIDISKVAIKQLEEKMPALSKKLHCVDFVNYNNKEPFDYIIAIQVFQHGTEKQIREYFEKVSQLLNPDGLLFLRVNSASTDIYFKHHIIETNSLGGITIRYLEGPKKDLDIHFYSIEELDVLCKDFDCIILPYENITKRDPPKTGTWSQWELILQKK